MSRWWRAHDEAVDDPKLILLSDKQHRAWFNLCCVSSQNGGKLPNMNVVAVKLRVSPGKAKMLVAELAALGLVDVTETSTTMHNWDRRQFKGDITDATNANRQKRYRARHSNGVTTVTETVTVTPTRDREQNTEAENLKKKDAADAALGDPEVELFRRGKQVLGNNAGGLIKQLLAAKDGKTNLARAAIETAAGKQNPREYIGAVLRNQEPKAGEALLFVDGRL